LPRLRPIIASAAAGRSRRPGSIESRALANPLTIVNCSPHALFVVWQSPENRAIHPVARLMQQDKPPRYEFAYVRGVQDAAKHGFVPFRELPDTHRVYWFDELPPLFTNRLIPANRADFAEHLTRLGLGEHDNPPAPEVVLARSGARKVTDRLEITAPPEFDATQRHWIYHAFVRGVRHVAGAEDAMRAVRARDTLRIERDVTDGWDARALLVLRTDRARLGFVPNILVEDLGATLENGEALRAEVVRVNLPPAPMQQRLLVRFSLRRGEGFAPLSTPRFEPLPATALHIDLGAPARMPTA
jgi:hypothetical protein